MIFPKILANRAKAVLVPIQGTCLVSISTGYFKVLALQIKKLLLREFVTQGNYYMG